MKWNENAPKGYLTGVNLGGWISQFGKKGKEHWDSFVTENTIAKVKELGFDTNKTAILCGPPIMIKFTLDGLYSLGFEKTQIYTTLEMRMKCGIGKCGRCNVGSKYICKDGPVFRFDELDELPDEY